MTLEGRLWADIGLADRDDVTIRQLPCPALARPSVNFSAGGQAKDCASRLSVITAVMGPARWAPGVPAVPLRHLCDNLVSIAATTSRCQVCRSLSCLGVCCDQPNQRLCLRSKYLSQSSAALVKIRHVMMPSKPAKPTLSTPAFELNRLQIMWLLCQAVARHSNPVPGL